MSRVLPNNIVKWNPFNPLFVCYDSQLKVYEVSQSKGHRGSTLVKTQSTPADVTTLDWYPHISKSQALAFGTSSGSVYFADWSRDDENTYVVKEMNKYHSRQCTEVTWNKQVPGQLAAGFEKLRKENCAFVYDLESYMSVDPDGGEVPVIFTVSSDSAISLCWLPLHAQLLAVGNDKGNISIFDLRQSSTPVNTIMAHTHTTSRFSKKVKGIRADPFNSHLFASFSDLGGEPVKLWDLRKIEKSKEAPVFTVYPHNSHSSNSSQSVVTAMEYSPVRPGIIAVGTNQQDTISLYTVKHSAVDAESRVPVMSISCPGGVKYMSWRGSSSAYDSGAADMYPAVSQAALPTESRGGNYAEETSRNEKLMYSPDNHHGLPNQPVASTDDICRNKLLVANRFMSLTEISVVEQQPLAVGALHDMVYGQGSSATFVSRGCITHPILSDRETTDGLSSPLYPPRLPGHPSYDVFDIDTTMRVRCSSGYAIDSGKNLQTLYEELDTFDPFSVAAESTIQLLRAWSWVDRVESLHTTDETFNLENCGILQLLTANTTEQSSVGDAEASQIHPLLGCTVYVSYRRSVGRLLCGWAALHGVGDMLMKKGASTKFRRGKSESSSKDENAPEEHPEAARLSDIVHEFEAIDNFERAAALALWHGDTSLAVKVLQKTVEACAAVRSAATDELSSVEEYDALGGRYIDDLTAEYIQLLSLVAMCIAGFGSSLASTKSCQTGVTRNGDPIVSDSMWASMCTQVVTQLRATKRRSAAYLSAACQFLLEVMDIETNSDANAGHSRYSVISDENIAFEDRIAFACTFLSRDEMYVFLRSLEQQCMEQGNIEGLVITGLNTDSGFELLQRYVDIRQDIQTAALLVARFPALSCQESYVDDTDSSKSKGTVESRMERQYLQEYRQLLNRWQAFMERAAMDVELGYRYRKYMSQNKELGKSVQSTGTTMRIGRAKSAELAGSHSGSARLCHQLPPHIDSPHVLLRCYYCSASLPVDVMQKPQQWQTSAWLRKQKPIMHCCPQCKRPLPKCYICLSYMGLVNPQRELMVALSQPSPVVDTGQSGENRTSALSDDASSRHTGAAHVNHNILEFGKWFMWCQHCKHGGHAGCMDSWFQQHGVCGVNGCNCRCETRPGGTLY